MRPAPQPAAGWKAQRERSSAFWLYLLSWIARRLGRGFTLLLLWPITLFFLATGSTARRASRDYLRRVLGRPPHAAELLRHFHTFAVCALDRLLILCGGAPRLNIVGEPPAELLRMARGEHGCIVLVSHVGSFELLRQLGSEAHRIPLRILLDRGHNPLMIGLLERLSPDFAASIIDAGRRGPELVLALRETLDQGCNIGIMADRVQGGEAALSVRLLGGEVRLPAGPWLLASVLRVPVIAAFGIYRGGRDYQAHFELLSPGLSASRAERQAAIQELAQRYAGRLEQRLREAPYNWFNFYPYWADASAGR